MPDNKEQQKLNDINNLSLESISNSLKEYLGVDKLPEKLPSIPTITNHRWVGEDGKHYSSWDISTGNMHISTGDGGAELFIKALNDRLYGK